MNCCSIIGEFSKSFSVNVIVHQKLAFILLLLVIVMIILAEVVRDCSLMELLHADDRAF